MNVATVATDAHALDVFHERERVGCLTFNPEQEAFGFGYDAVWLQSPRRFQLSPHIPFNGAVDPGAVRRYVDNLLPEGRALDVICSIRNIQKTHLFALIRELGREAAGSLSFLPAGQRPETQVAQRRPLNPGELQQRIDERNETPFSIWDGRVRMSMAGYQDKLLVLREGSQLYLVDGALSSSHILKPEPLSQSLPCMVANEHFCMTLVNRISQARFKENWAAQVEILRVPSPVLCVTRFDRAWVDGGVRRLHTIDGCQALDLPATYKYERTLGNAPEVRNIRDGASFEKLAALRPHLANAAVGVRQMAMWAITTLLLGNSDAHGKNISFMGSGTTLTVAPFYDLVSVAPYSPEQIDHEMAMAFGDEFSMPAVKSYALADFCTRLGFPRSTFARELKTLCDIAETEALAQAWDSIYQGDESDLVARLATHVVARAQFLREQAMEIPRIKGELL